MVPGKPGFDRIKWCFENTLVTVFPMVLASVDDQGETLLSRLCRCSYLTLGRELMSWPYAYITFFLGVSLPLTFPQFARATRLSYNVQSTQLPNITIPDTSVIRTIGKNDLRWRTSVMELYEWIGMASLQSDRSVNMCLTTWLSLLWLKLDNIWLFFVDIFLELLPGTGSTLSSASIVLLLRAQMNLQGVLDGWSRYLALYPLLLSCRLWTNSGKAFVTFALTGFNKKGRNEYFGVLTQLGRYSIGVSPYRSILGTSSTEPGWANLTVWGFQDSPISWINQEHGHLMTGENYYSFFLWSSLFPCQEKENQDNGTYVMVESVGAHDTHS